MRPLWVLLFGAAAAVPMGHGTAHALEDHALVRQLNALETEHAALLAKYQLLEERLVAMDADCKALSARCTLQGDHPANLARASASAAKDECTISDFITLEDHFDLIDPPTEVATRLEQMDNFSISRLLATHAGDLLALNYSDATVTRENIRDIMRSWNNDTLAAANLAGGRMRALCNVFMIEVDASIAEINWCREQGVPGIMVFGHQTRISSDNKMIFDYYYSAEALRFWKEAARLDMFVYLHPHDLPFAPDGLFDDEVHELPDGIEPGGANWLEASGINLTSTVSVKAYDPDSTKAACASGFQGAMWGYAVSVAQVVQNLIVHGVFDEVPDLKVVIGHSGELIAYWLPRIDYKLSSSDFETSCKANPDAVYPTGFQHNFTYYFRKHFWITTSGNFDTAGLKHLMALMPEDRLLFSVDSPLSSIEDAVTWFKGIPSTNPEISCEALQKVAYQNAEALLNWAKPTS